ncbi:hypothetical protein BGW39_002015 [Mortierella sp. 14UC]|nr:hypothetical protein BGW39_002015 [Mortierella sp. 14UC]
MNNKIDLATIRARFPQEWPRYTVGMIATVGLKRAIQTASYIFTMKSVFTSRIPEESAALGITPLQAIRIQQGLYTGVATVGIIANSLALRGAIKRNPRNIRAAFRMWAITAAVIHVPSLLNLFVNGRGEEVTDWQVVEYFVNGVALTLLDGWAMFVYMRDLKGQKRNSYGFLVEDKEQVNLEKGLLDEQA